VSPISEVAAAGLGGTTVICAAAWATTRRKARSALRSLHAERERRQRETAALTEREKRLLEEVRHLVTTRLPAQAQHLVAEHHPVPGPLHPEFAASEVGEFAEAALGQLADAVVKSRRRADTAAQAALRGASGDIQALSFRLQTEIEALQRIADAPDLADRFFTIDHLNEQVARLVQKAAIVCGGWPGMVRPDTYLAEVVTGAQSRLRGFERVRVSSQLLDARIGIAGRAAEPVAVACAELMANALEHSRDDLEVQVSLVQGDSGTVSVIIDDAGTGMSPEAARRAARLLSGRDRGELMLTELGDPPALGFAAAGRLAADHGFSVDVGHPSPYGGVRAVISIPPQLLTEMEGAAPMAALAPLPAAPPRTRAAGSGSGSTLGGNTPGGATLGGSASDPLTAFTELPEHDRATALGELPTRRAARRQAAAAAAAAEAAEREAAEMSTAAPTGTAARAAAPDGSDLPQRRRRTRAAAEPAAAARPLDPERAASVFDALQRGVRSGRAAEAPDPDADAAERDEAAFATDAPAEDTTPEEAQ